MGTILMIVTLALFFVLMLALVMAGLIVDHPSLQQEPQDAA